MKILKIKDIRILVAVIVAFLAVPVTSQAQTRSIEGAWRGSGYLKPASGAKENVRCRVSYSKITKTLLRFVGTCASSAGSVRQSGEITRATKNRYIGVFNNSEYGISGRIRVIVNGARQSVYLTGNQGSGKLSLSKR